MAKPDAAKRAPDLFEDPAIARAAQDDPLAIFLSRHWKQILAVLVAVGVIVYAVTTFQQTNEAKRSSASRAFSDVRQTYNLFVSQEAQLERARQDLSAATEAAKKDEAAKRVSDLEKSVADSKVKLELMIKALEDILIDPFPRLARLYRGLLAARTGDIGAARTALGSESWETTGSPGSSDRFAAELSALVLGRALAEKDDSIAEGRQILEGLAARGDTARVPAAISLAALATTPETKAAARTLLEKIQSDDPEQSKFVADALAELKG